MTSVSSQLALSELISRTGRIPNADLAIHRYTIDSGDPLVSFVVPVHNQEGRILECLRGIQSSASLPHEILVIVDHCSDRTSQRVHDWARMSANEARSSPLTRVVIVESDESDLFETVSDNLGFSLADGEILIEVQADMVISHVDFDRRVVDALQQFPRLLAVSGRGGHAHAMSFRANPLRRLVSKAAEVSFSWLAQWRGRYSPCALEYYLSDSIGRVGKRVDLRAGNVDDRSVFVTGTVMRGPLGLRRADLLRLGMLDSERFFLGDDDHDLVYRAVQEKNDVLVGYLPMRFDAPLELGSVRVEKSAEEKARMSELLEYYAEKQWCWASLRVTTPASRPATMGFGATGFGIPWSAASG